MYGFHLLCGIQIMRPMKTMTTASKMNSCPTSNRFSAWMTGQLLSIGNDFDRFSRGLRANMREPERRIDQI